MNNTPAVAQTLRHPGKAGPEARLIPMSGLHFIKCCERL